MNSSSVRAQFVPDSDPDCRFSGSTEATENGASDADLPDWGFSRTWKSLLLAKSFHCAVGTIPAVNHLPRYVYSNSVSYGLYLFSSGAASLLPDKYQASSVHRLVSFDGNQVLSERIKLT